MPPKKGARSSPKSAASPTSKVSPQASLARSPSASRLGRKSEKAPEQLTDVQWLRALTSEALEKDIKRALSLFARAREDKKKELLIAASEAIATICSDQLGFVRFVEAQGVEPIAQTAAEPLEAGGKYSYVAVESMCKGAKLWLEYVDPVDFTELSRLLYLTLWLGGIDEDVAVAAILAIGRFTLHRAEHAAGMLKAGVLNVIHTLLAVHSGPEFVGEVFTLLYLLSDMPVEAVGEYLVEEIDLVTTVCEALQDAPLNLRLQVSGLRLLSMWSVRHAAQEELLDAIQQADAKKLLDNAVSTLQGAGFEHCATWLEVMARRALDPPIVEPAKSTVDP